MKLVNLHSVDIIILIGLLGLLVLRPRSRYIIGELLLCTCKYYNNYNTNTKSFTKFSYLVLLLLYETKTRTRQCVATNGVKLEFKIP